MSLMFIKKQCFKSEKIISAYHCKKIIRKLIEIERMEHIIAINTIKYTNICINGKL